MKNVVTVLDLKVMLPIIQKAIIDKSLQIYTNPDPKYVGCKYAGPCAIGSCIPFDDREFYDSEGNTTTDTTVGSWMDHGGFVLVDRHQGNDICQLQLAHDDGDIKYFELQVSELVAKYL